MEYKDKNGNVLYKTPTLNPKTPIDRFKDQSKLAIYLKQNLLTKLDKFTSSRSLFLLLILCYLLGKNLNLYLSFLIFLEIYILSYRLIRFWIQRWLMYMIDFCYPGNFLLMYFIIFDDSNLNIFITVFSAASCVISLAVIICDNQVDLDNSDYLHSCSIHVLPIVTCWAIRWKHKLYYDDIFEGKSLLTVGDVPFKFDTYLFKFVGYLYLFWLSWAVVYFVLNTMVLRKYAYSDLYESAICDFYKDTFPKIFGDHKKNTVAKYLLMHFIYLTVVTPIGLLNFYSFKFSCFYLCFIVVFLGYNQAVKQRKYYEDIVNKGKEKSQ